MLFWLLFSVNILSQGIKGFQVEMFFKPINGISNVNFYIDAVSQVWSEIYQTSNLFQSLKTSNSGDEIRYYITAIVNNSGSTPSNIVSTNGGFYKKSTPVA